MSVGLECLLGAAGFAAGVQNALAGGGSFLTFPALLLTGLDPRAANVTSTVALFPGQIATGWAGRANTSGTPTLSLRTLCAISVIGGALGALLLLATPSSIFAALVPWLVLFATAVFAWGSFFRRSGASTHHAPTWAAATMQSCISIYGGYFGGGIGILMLAALTLSGLSIRTAGATKNVLAGVMNFSAVIIFIASKGVAWQQAAILGITALAGGQVGAYALQRVNEKVMRICITLLGIGLSVGLFLRYRAS